MTKITALLLAFLILGPTVVMACSCCPMTVNQNFKTEISTIDHCCSITVLQKDPATLSQVTNFDFTSSRLLVRTFLAYDSTTDLNRTTHSNSPPGSDQLQNPQNVPLYLSNLVLRF